MYLVPDHATRALAVPAPQGGSQRPGSLPVAGSRLAGVGACRPSSAWSADELGAPFAKDGGWIEARTGIKALRRLGGDESPVALAVAAADTAMRQAGVSASEVDLVITATCSMRPEDVRRLDRAVVPSAAHVLLNAACSGFCYALAAADSAIRVGNARHVLIIGVEHMSRMLDSQDLGTSIIFGDGAGAVVVAAANGTDVGVGPVVWGSDGTGSDLIANAVDGTGRLRMSGQQVFRWAVETMPAFAARACTAAGVRPEQIDVFVPHQANLRIIDAVARKLGMRRAVVADDVACSGNTSAASVPLALSRLIEEGRALGGQLALLVGFGAGLSYAGQVVVVP